LKKAERGRISAATFQGTKGMFSFASGAAFIDGTGKVLAADPGFVAELGLGPEDPTGELRARAETNPQLRALLSGEGPDVARVPGAGGEAVVVERVRAAAGALLLARAPRTGEWLEHAMRSQGLTRIAAGLAHDIKNPLNAMALQLALLTDKLASTADASTASAGHLGAVREQIGRVNEVVRRFLDVTDPSAPLGYTDLGALLTDTASLFGHDARRRRIDLTVEAARGTVRSRCEPGRVGRLVLALFSRALNETPDAGRLVARAEVDGESAVVRIEHVAGDPDPETGYYTEVATAAAEALGGELAVAGSDGIERLTLRLPRNGSA
jgi:signal transduction histidine kinase